MKLFSLSLMLVGLSMSFTAFTYNADLSQGIYQLNRGEFNAAIAEFEPLVEEGYAPAQYQMALIYQNGWGVKKNQDKALELMSLSATQNYPDALFDLAQMYSEGKWVKQDLATAFALTQKAALKDLVGAQFNLGVMYQNGQGVPKDYRRASQWYEKAAKQNYALAQFNLALLYFEGNGVKKDVEQSYIWNSIAAMNGYENAAKSRDMDERNLNIEQLQKAREKASRLHKQMIHQLEIQAKLDAEKPRF